MYSTIGANGHTPEFARPSGVRVRSLFYGRPSAVDTSNSCSGVLKRLPFGSYKTAWNTKIKSGVYTALLLAFLTAPVYDPRHPFAPTKLGHEVERRARRDEGLSVRHSPELLQQTRRAPTSKYGGRQACKRSRSVESVKKLTICGVVNSETGSFCSATRAWVLTLTRSVQGGLRVREMVNFVVDITCSPNALRLTRNRDPRWLHRRVSYRCAGAGRQIRAP